jgi:hypothetical protein
MQQDTSRRTDPRVTIDPATRVTAASEDGRVLLHVETGRICAINGMGSRIWAELTAGHSVPEIVDLLVCEYDAPREHIESDVQTFITNLVNKKYLRTTGTLA